MATIDDIKLLVQARADLIDDPGAIGLKTPGSEVEIKRGVTVKTGEAWGEAKAFEIFLGGIAEYLDDVGLSELADIKAKVNELIGAYNQLRADYNAGVVPTTAPAVTPLP